MNKNFVFSSGVELDLGAVASISPMLSDPDRQTFFVWVRFEGRVEKYRYLLGANAEQAHDQYLHLTHESSKR